MHTLPFPRLTFENSRTEFQKNVHPSYNHLRESMYVSSQINCIYPCACTEWEGGFCLKYTFVYCDGG